MRKKDERSLVADSEKFKKAGEIQICKRKTFFFIAIFFLLFPAFHGVAQDTGDFGINTTLRTFGGESKKLKELGVGAIRVSLAWQLIRTLPEEYDWRLIDRFVRETRDKNIEILFSIRTRTSQETSQHRSKSGLIRLRTSSVDGKAWLHFVKALAFRYRGQGICYELEHAVNDETFWKGTVDEYLELLEEGYEAIKQADPQARVLASALGCGILQNLQTEGERQKAWRRFDLWLKPILASKHYDVVNVHDYYFPADLAINGITFQSYLDHIREVMKALGLENTPIWITETGYISSPSETNDRKDEGSPEKQAQWLQEAYQQALASGVERIYWVMLNDRNEPYLGSMGLIDAKGNPRPSWNVLQQLIKTR